MATWKQFIREHGITMRCEYADSNPNMVADYPMTHWKCSLRNRGGRKMTIHFSQGVAHIGEPKIEDVLDCLVSDSTSVDQASFEAWAADLGYDLDSRKAEKIYNACLKNQVKLLQFLGNAYEQATSNVERL